MENTLIASIKNSGFIGHLILLSLFILSVIVWSVFIKKWHYLKEIERKSGGFIKSFAKQKKDLFGLSNTITEQSLCPAARLLQNALKDLQYHLVSNGTGKIPVYAVDDVFNGTRRYITDLDLELTYGMTMLATATAISPLLGLFGTVWGIMESFRDMWIHGSANITVVAPGISDALLTTVVGLLVAVPSAVAYNMLQNRINRYETSLENFSSELITSIERIYVER